MSHENKFKERKSGDVIYFCIKEHGSFIATILNTYWTNPSPLSKISMLRRWIA